MTTDDPPQVLSKKLGSLLAQERELRATRSEVEALRGWMERVQTITEGLSQCHDPQEARHRLLSLLLRNAPYEFAGMLSGGALTLRGLEPGADARQALLECTREIHGEEVMRVSTLPVLGELWVLVGSVPSGAGDEPLTILVGRTARTVAYYPPPWDAELERMGYLLSTIAHVHAAVRYRADLIAERNGLAQQVSAATEQLQRALASAEAAAEAAEAASEAKSQFLAHMSHELRTPMNGILGTIQLLQLSRLPPDANHLVTMLHNSSESLLALLNDILDISRVEAGKLEIHPAPFEPRALVRQTIDTFHLAAQGKGLELRSQLAEATPTRCEGDVTRIRQILMNLVGNAVKFTDEGAITLRVGPGRSPLEGLRFEIEDTGIGIAAENLERAFEKFTQVDDSLSRRFGGSGLGLAICHGLATALGGELGARSEPGVGSCFWLELPLRSLPPLEPEPVAGVDPDAPRPRPGMRVLLAEDNNINQIVISTMLERYGCVVEVVGNGVAAVRSACEQHPDVVLMDIELPDLNGLEAARRIRAFGGTEGVHIVALTSHAFSKYKERCWAAGMNDFVPKPVTLEELGRMLERVAARPSAVYGSGAGTRPVKWAPA